MKNNFLNIALTNIYSKPSVKSEVTSQILYGEKFKILSKKKNWVKIKTNFD
ncbi:SH3 domain-containing protein, partial [Candidatus Pelagibacter sp.]|nr:SH3 domain-containing protein [Candidatus Pelagibacter sp.]